MKTKIYLLSIIVLVLSLFACGGSPEKEAFVPYPPANYMVLLDLSDRLLNPGQAEYDIEMAFHVFEAFEESVRKNITINSKDRFAVMIAPQENVPYDAMAWEKGLYLDMGKVDIQLKDKKLKELRANLKKQLKELYLEARYSERPGDYSGADLWRFFHDRLPESFGLYWDNYLLVLTDGYFDFESRALTGQMQQMGTTTAYISLLRNASDWKALMEKENYGIHPAGRSFPGMKVCVAGIRPKSRNLFEKDILRYTWEKWLEGMDIEDIKMMSFGPVAGERFP